MVVVNFSNRPQTGGVMVAHSGEFALTLPGRPGVDQTTDLAQLALGAFEWRIYHHTLLK